MKIEEEIKSTDECYVPNRRSGGSNVLLILMIRSHGQCHSRISHNKQAIETEPKPRKEKERKLTSNVRSQRFVSERVTTMNNEQYSLTADDL